MAGMNVPHKGLIRKGIISVWEQILSGIGSIFGLQIVKEIGNGR